MPKEEHLVPIGKAKVVQEGEHLTLVAHGRVVLVCQKVVAKLAQRSIRVELIDLRTIKPLDIATAAHSVRKTHHVVLVEEGHYFTGICAEVGFEIQQHCFDFLDAPIAWVTQCETPMPYSKALERETMPTEDKIERAILETLNRMTG